MTPGSQSDADTRGVLARACAWAAEPGWRRLLVIGWAVYAVSFLLPTLVSYISFPTPPGGEPDTGQLAALAGWEAFVWALIGAGDALGVTSAVTNLLVVGGVLHGRWSATARWPVFVLAAATLLNASFWPYWVLSEGDKSLRIGYFAWVASFACVAIAFWLRRRGKTTTTAE